MEYVLLILTVMMASAKAVLNRRVKDGTQTLYQTLRFNLFSFVFAFITVCAVGIKGLGELFNAPILLAFGLAICTLGLQIFSMKAVQIGPVSISSLFCYCGFIIPTVFGCVYYKEPFRVLQGVGIAMILFAFVFSTKGGDEKKPNFKWLLCSIGALLSSGLIGVFQKIFTREYPNSSLNNFVILSFAMILAMGVIYLFVVKLAKNKRKTKNLAENYDKLEKKEVCLDWKRRLFFAVLLGVLIGLINIVNTYLSGVLPSVIVFPAINGGAIFATTILSAVIYKEKPTTRQTIGLAIGILAILLIALA